MRFNTATVISAIALLIGVAMSMPYIWIPATVLIASITDLFTRQWVTSDRLGSARELSITLKFGLSLVGLYGMIGQFVCIGLVIWWVVT